MKRVYEVKTANGPFFFFNDNKPLAAEHARQLSNDPNFPHIRSEDIGRVKFVGWAEEGTL